MVTVEEILIIVVSYDRSVNPVVNGWLKMVVL